MFDICIGVIFRTSCRIGCLAIVSQKFQLLQSLTVFCVSLAVKHKALGHLIIAFLHQGHFHLVLDVLHLDTFFNIQVTEYLRDTPQINWFFNRVKRLDNGVHNLV